MVELVKQIVSYLNFLETQMKLSISVHFSNDVLQRLPGEVFEKLLSYNVHKNYYCSVVKRTNRDKCICLQQEMLRYSNTPNGFCHTCFAGVKEYIQQIMSEDKILGYIAVSGYRESSKPDGCVDEEIWKNNLSAAELPKDMLDAVISPLRIMFEQLFSFPMHRGDQSEYNLILQYLHQCHGQVVLDDLCRQFGRSKSYISHLFGRNCDISFPAYCNMLKLSYAKMLLSGENTSVTEAALDAGYHDVSYFIRQFKEMYGVTPLQYKKHIDGYKS